MNGGRRLNFVGQRAAQRQRRVAMVSVQRGQSQRPACVSFVLSFSLSTSPPPLLAVRWNEQRQRRRLIGSLSIMRVCGGQAARIIQPTRLQSRSAQRRGEKEGGEGRMTGDARRSDSTLTAIALHCPAAAVTVSLSQIPPLRVAHSR